jgi:hypothetical protein
MHNREKHLSLLSGMIVKREVLIKDGSEHTVYTFYKSNGDTAKQFFTYPKAKAFAEGINFARSEKPQFLLDTVKFPEEPINEDETCKVYIVWYENVCVTKFEYAHGGANYLICKAGVPIVNFSK